MKSKILLILFLITTTLLYSQRDVRVISSDFNSVTIEYTPIYTDTSVVSFDGVDFRKAELYFGSIKNAYEWGSPVIQERIINVGVPSEFGNTMEVITSAYQEISGQLIPIPYQKKDSVGVSFDFKKNSEYNFYESKEDIITFGEIGLLRDVYSQPILVNPIKFFPSQNKIRLYTKIIFKINFSTNGVISSTPADDLIDGILINYNVAKYWNNESAKRKLNKLTVTNSVLASGKWVRFEAPEEGIYKIGKSELSLYGIDANTVDPRTIKIYNNSGKALPENNTTPRPNDLEENAILVVGEADGKFDDADYILFYGRGSSFWDFASDGKTVGRYFNSYSVKNYFWITSSGSNGKRVADTPGLNSTPTFNQTTSEAFASWEIDKINLGQTGRQFFGDDFSNSVLSRTYTNTLNGRISTVPITYNLRFVVAAPSSLTLKLSENGSQIYQQSLAGYSGDYRVGNAQVINATYNGELVDNRSTLNLSITPSTISTIGYLDYFTIKYEKDLKAFSDYLMFFSNSTGGLIEYSLNGFSSSNIRVFDVTNYSDIKLVTNYTLLSGGECKFQNDESATQRSKYIAVENSGFKLPSNPTEISNSNLHGEVVGAKYIIITHKNFIDAANKLKNYKENRSPITISTYVADIDQIYNEFSGGVVDPTAVRDYLKYTYDNWQIKPDYVLLFGKGTYDYKNVEGFGDNFVPTWQSEESLILVNGADSYTTDDYFARVSGPDLTPDLIIGRITCTTAASADAMVNKIEDYELNQEKGEWRNLITLISDDGCKSTTCEEYAMHTIPSENLSNFYFPKSFNYNKIYSAAYPDVITGQGRRKPDVNKAIIDAMNNGSLLVNYFGHGSPELWADEHIFEKSVILPQLQNDKYFFLGAATCDFGYFDIPNYQSAAEAIMFLPHSGAIASFTANRLVFAGSNEALMYRFITKLFNSGRDSLNLGIPIGKAAFQSKTTYVNDQKYNIFGDPTLRLKVPQYSAGIDSINGQNLSVDIQVKALSKTKIDGTVLKADNTPWNDFNGEGVLSIYDSERRVHIDAINYDVTIPGGLIFNGRVTINNGKFSESFIVPKDISYENRNGKVILYFFNNSADGLGYTNKIIVGGTDSSVSNDGKGPDIEIFFDDVAYNNGYLVNQNPNLIVKLSDETGLNTTGTGVGHKLEGVINQKLNNPIDFTNYFTGDLDAGGKSGLINYKFSALESGDHELLVKAWDVFNNFSEQNTFFTVVDGSDLVIRDIYNYPNPFSEKTQFTFQQNLTEPIDVKIKVYTIAGRLIKEIEQFNVNDKFVVVNWDGRDADGDQLANGTYLYKIIIKTADGAFNKSVLGKLAVIK
jgi:hypothetical protein